MGRHCTICEIAEHDPTINEAIVAGVSYRNIARQWTVSEGDVPVRVSISAISRHVTQGHVSPALQRVEQERQEVAESLRDRVELMYKSTRYVLRSALREGKPNLVLAAIREMRSVVELHGKITGELRDGPSTVVNVLADPEWLRLRAVIMEVLAQHPEARFAVADRLAALESGDDEG